MKILKTLFSISLGAGLLTGSAAKADLVQNGGFETGDLTDWTTTGSYMVVAPSYDQPYAHSGDYYLNFGPMGSDGTISQTISDTSGTTYLLSYWVIGDGLGTSDVNAYWNNTLVSYIPTPIPDQPYTEYTALVTGTGSDMLTIGLRDDPYFDGLDDISLTPVPEPTTVVAGAMLLLPFGASALRMLRKSRIS